MTAPDHVVIDVFVPLTADVEVVAQEVAVVAAPDPGGAHVIVVPSPGPPGPPGEDGADLTPEERQAIVDDAEAEVLEELEPPVDLVVLFENSLL